MKIEVVGPGCTKCKTLMQLTEQAVAELGIPAEITKVTDLQQIIAMGVMLTPALVVDGKIRTMGRVPVMVDLKDMLRLAGG
jgi:small redox-active disulfide protein 2